MAQANGGAGYGSVGIGFTDGEYMPIEELRVPVFDLGFQLSDMCYDALRVWNGRFFRQDEHLRRFDRSIRERRYATLGYDIDQIGEVLHECVRRSGLRRSMVTVIATRGTPSDGLKDLRTCRNRLGASASSSLGSCVPPMRSFLRPRRAASCRSAALTANRSGTARPGP